MMIIIVAIIKYRLDEGCRHPPTQSGYDTYLSRCHSPCNSNRSPMFGCNGSCYVFVLVNECHQNCHHQKLSSSKIVIKVVIRYGIGLYR
jgi:hypothetical protein